jgi:hypothetical protein
MCCKQAAGLKRRSSQIDGAKGKAGAYEQERATCEYKFKRFFEIQAILLSELSSIAPRGQLSDSDRARD